ncbi:MAG: Stp1/IreP family PP2C-type Ser/Thr phosphatase [Geobacteraceae bacterium]|nr:Stp1/IreP family PP2C-type Ser/Thr phosphatase [Geobacteraceae bacterium]
MLTLSTCLADSFAETDTGLVRQENEDSLLLHVSSEKEQLEQKGALAIVADGVGGGNSGKIASSLAVTEIRERYYAFPAGQPLIALKQSMMAANHEILARSRQDPSLEGMATTCTVFLMIGNDGFVCHAGDSRAYLLRDGNLRQLTEDHTLVNKLLQDGLLTFDAAKSHPQRNIIVKALGSDEEFEPETLQLELEGNDTVLLCSDGLHGLIPDGTIASTLGSLPLQQAGKTLITLAKQAGGTDNITVILLRKAQGKGLDGNATRPYRVVDRKKISIMLISLIVALLAGGLLYFWASYGLNKIMPPSLIDVLKINK